MRKAAALAAVVLGVLLSGFAMLPAAHAASDDLDTNRPRQSALPQVACVDSNASDPQPTSDLTQPATVCVHWTTTGSNAATNDFAGEVLTTAEYVLQTYKDAGYRAPLTDQDAPNDGGNSALDIYLEDVGPDYYGFCTTDDSIPQRDLVGDSSPAYCVLDNDYAAKQFGSRTAPLDAMRVTAAHELFHSVQFAYNADADTWLMEGTAVWAEDELFTNINDNLQYMPASPLSHRSWPLDDDFAGSGTGYEALHVYGDWVFFRWLTEHFPEVTGNLPTIIRQIWEAEDSTGSTVAPDSLGAIAQALKANGTTWPAVLARFSADNLHARQTYSEGAANKYPVAAPAATATITTSKKTITKKFSTPHLASSTLRLKPKKDNNHKITVTVTLAKNSAAAVTVTATTGYFTTTLLKPNAKGKASITVPFGNKAYVDVTVVNADTTMNDCGNGGNAAGDEYACGGVPAHLHLNETITAALK